MLRAGDVELTLGLAEGQMRALHRIADEPGAVERSRGGDPVGIARGRSQRIGPAHAIAVDADRPALRSILGLDERDHGRNILHYWWNRHLGSHRAHALMLGAAVLEHLRSKDRVAPGTVVEIG